MRISSTEEDIRGRKEVRSALKIPDFDSAARASLRGSGSKPLLQTRFMKRVSAGLTAHSSYITFFELHQAYPTLINSTLQHDKLHLHSAVLRDPAPIDGNLP